MNKIKKYFREAREQAKRRKSPWNLVLIPLVAIGVGLAYYLQFKALWFLHVLIYPEHGGQLSEFWREGVSFSAFIPGFLLVIPVFFSSLVLGMMIANLLAWCIPPARIIFEREAKGIKRVSFREAMKALGKAAVYLVPVCLVLGIIGAATLKSLR